jgi:TonB family protein
MNSAPAQPSAWPRRRSFVLVGVIFLLQLACIFWLSDRKPARQRVAVKAPLLNLTANAPRDLLALRDPTLFALPHMESFSGAVWLKAPPVPSSSFNWKEPPRWLPVPVQELGVSFASTLNATELLPRYVVAKTEPEVSTPDIPPLAANRERSTLRLDHGLARLKLSTPLQLPSWPNSEILTNTVLKLMVSAQGYPISFTVLSSSGYTPADKWALEQARKTRFEPIGSVTSTNPTANLTWGEMIFEWHTTPAPAPKAVQP